MSNTDNGIVLATIPGVNLDQIKYTFGDKGEWEAPISSIALYKLLPSNRKPSVILAFCTKEAEEKAFPTLKKELEGYEVKVECVRWDEPDLVNNSEKFVERFCSAVLEQKLPKLLLDLTHGLRHLSFYALLGAQYLVALEKVEIVGAYYALVDFKVRTGSFVALDPLLRFFDWTHAVRLFAQHGDATALARLLEQLGTQEAKISQEATRISKVIRNISQARIAGLPLELGLRTEKFFDSNPPQFESLQKLLRRHKLPLADELSGLIKEALEPFLPKENNRKLNKKGDWKLDHKELERQMWQIDELFEFERIPQALGLMREWLVSFVQYKEGQYYRWCDKDERQKAASRLSRISKLSEGKPEDRNALVELWDKLTELRNAYHHHGMRAEDLLEDKATKNLEKVRKEWEALRGKWQEFELPWQKQDDIVLLTPLGTTRGVLFNALLTVKKKIGRMPDRCVVICSDASKAGIDEAASKAGFPSDKIVRIEVKDPYGGTGEIEQVARNALDQLALASQVFVNYTGGTTLMGLIVQRIVDEIRRGGGLLLRFGLIDKRSPKEQQEDPYRECECFWLDDKERDKHDQDGDGQDKE